MSNYILLTYLHVCNIVIFSIEKKYIFFINLNFIQSEKFAPSMESGPKCVN